MTSNWRISGGIGAPEEETPVLTQGLGFPLRPVDGTEGADLIGLVPIATGVFTQWMGTYQTGVIYPEGSVVRDGDWLMVALRATVDKPAPIPSGDATWSMADVPAFATQSDESVVYSGHQYTFSESGWVKGLRIWVTELSANTNYRITIIDSTDPNSIKTTVFEEPVLTENGWKIISLVDQLVLAGTVLTVFIDALNSGADTVVAGGWTYTGAENTLPPPLSGWNHRTQQDLLRISTTDLDSTDRTSELLGMIPGTTLVFAETARPERSYTYRVINPVVDNTTFVDVPVELTTTGGGGAPEAGNATTMTATVPVPLPTEYAELAAGVPTPTWATAVGFLAFDGVDQGGSANGYGVDFNFQSATISEDWDVMNIGS